MARALRIEFEGAFYHVMARGNEKRAIFYTDDDYACFLRIISAGAARFGFILHAYCLMPNHYHFLLETPRGNLSAGMHFIGAMYSQRFNLTHERVGHLFQGRFKALLVERETYLLQLNRYLHQNPVRAGLVTRAWDYEWSSCRAFLGMGQPPSWLRMLPTLVHFGAGFDEQHRAYREFLGDPQAPLWDKVIGQLALGSEGFIELAREKARARCGSSEEFAWKSAWESAVDPKAILRAIRLEFRCDDRGFSHPWIRSNARLTAIHLLREKARLPLREIASWAGLSISGVSRAVDRFQEMLEIDGELARNVLAVERHLAGEKSKVKT